mmetsp:Transcript_19301/g.38197  ORF Transcript_19301/g.38197 Transcript_19301/m.38197 type:complete len:93 (-) Transcript_19301:93-371(-)
MTQRTNKKKQAISHAGVKLANKRWALQKQTIKTKPQQRATAQKYQHLPCAHTTRNTNCSTNAESSSSKAQQELSPIDAQRTPAMQQGRQVKT